MGLWSFLNVFEVVQAVHRHHARTCSDCARALTLVRAEFPGCVIRGVSIDPSSSHMWTVDQPTEERLSVPLIAVMAGRVWDESVLESASTWSDEIGGDGTFRLYVPPGLVPVDGQQRVEEAGGKIYLVEPGPMPLPPEESTDALAGAIGFLAGVGLGWFLWRRR